MKILVLITTYNRPEKLLSLLEDIKKEAKDHKIEIIIYEDHSNADYKLTRKYASNNFKKLQYYTCDSRFGKIYYWLLTNHIYESAKRSNFNYIVQLPDDVRLVPGFFEKAIKLYEEIQDPKKICLNILQDKRTDKPMWTPVNQVEYANVFRTGWVDMCFIAKRKYLNALDYGIYEVDPGWAGREGRSSGVGKQISERLYLKYNMYWAKESLVVHGTHHSVMHSNHRKQIPLIAKPVFKAKDKIIAGIASIPERENALKLVINSIIKQVDEIFVYLNNYKSIPDYLKHHKIKAFLSKNEIDDLGDIGKFYKINKLKGYYFTMDDDIVYPADYVIKMIDKIEQHKRKYVVSLHGRIFDKLPVHSYYKGHTSAFQCLSLVKKDAFAHVVGTGVLAFHTDTIKIKLSDFKASNMADIWFSKKCHDNNVKCLIMAHENRWIREITIHDTNYSIYTFCNKNDKYQTQVVNEIKWNKLPETRN